MEFQIETNSLLVKPLLKEDFDKIFSLLANPHVMEYVRDGSPRSEKEAKEYFELLLNHQQKHGFSFGGVYEKTSSEFVGVSGPIYLNFDDSQADIEIAYALFPKFWGKGYATELSKGCINWIFQNLPVHRVLAIVHRNNSRSRSVLEKSGMHFVGTEDHRGKNQLRYEIAKKN